VSYQVPLTVARALERIHRHDYVIPAIQREFVWSQTQIGNLFDSLLRKYPIGTFLFWQVPASETRQYAFYDVMRDFHELKNRHSQVITPPDSRDVTAILDGQQRLTSLNIGLVGSYAVKRPGSRTTSSDAYPTKKLQLDLCYEPNPDDELGVHYMFRFLTTGEVAADNASGSHHWVSARLGLDIGDGKDIFKYVQSAGLAEHPRAYEALYTLWEALTQQPTISYFELENHSLDQVLDIFIRVNSGGTVLSKSDLLLSVATAQFTQRDAREAIHGLVDDLNAIAQGFNFSKDLVLKAGLLLTNRPDIRFTAVSFTAESMSMLDNAWDDIDRSLRVAVRLLAAFGLSAKNITANSVLLPVADYIHQRRLGDEFVTSTAMRNDREQVRTWVIRSLVKAGIWGSSLDQTLIRCRRVLRLQGGSAFPRSEIEREMATMGKSLDLGPDELEDLVDSTYQQKRSFLLLSLLYPGVDTRNEFHVDHVFPRSRFTDARLRAAGISGDLFDTMQDACNRLANLQLLEGSINVSKQQAMPMDWAVSHYPNANARAGYLAAHDLHDLPTDLSDFLDLYHARRERMKARLADLLGAVSSGMLAPLPEPLEQESSGMTARSIPEWPPPRLDKQTRPKSSGGRSRQVFNRSLKNIPNGPITFKIRGIVYNARVDDGRVVLEDGRRFDSPSGAADAAHGGSNNGWKVWTRNGQSLAEIHP
jgi:uncharacterized protein DUF262